MGNFKIDFACYNSSLVKNYVDNIASLGCEQLITIIASIRQFILDHIYVDRCMMINDDATVAVIEHDITDQVPNKTQLQCNAHQKQKSLPRTKKIRSHLFGIFVENLETHLQK